MREAPPQPPAPVGRKLITISGRRLPPPPRKVIIERMAPLPTKPQSVLVERWLPYQETKRRIIYKGAPSDPVCVKPRNVVIQWEAPNVVRKVSDIFGGIHLILKFEFNRCICSFYKRNTSFLALLEPIHLIMFSDTAIR